MVVYTVCTRCGRPCTDCARPPSAVYKLCRRPYTSDAHGPSVSRTRPCTQPVRGKTRPGTRPVPDRVRTVYTAVYPAVFTARVHGCVRTMYTAVHGPSMTRTRPYNTAVYTVVYPVHGRVPCTCTCLRPVYTAIHGRVQTAYGPCTWSVHDPNAAAAPTRPCLQPVPCTRPFTACTYRVHHDTVHSRHRKS